MLSLSLTLDSTIEAFDATKQVDFKIRLAAMIGAGVGPEHIQLRVAPGSVVVMAAVIMVNGTDAASQVAATLNSGTTNSTALSESLDVAITVVTTPTIESVRLDRRDIKSL